MTGHLQANQEQQLRYSNNSTQWYPIVVLSWPEDGLLQLKYNNNSTQWYSIVVLSWPEDGRLQLKYNNNSTQWDPIVVLSWPEDGRSRPKHVAKYNLIVIIASCLMYVVY